MSPIMAAEHAATAIVGSVVLVMIGYGTVAYGFLEMFRKPMGQTANRLAVVATFGLLIEVVWA